VKVVSLSMDISYAKFYAIKMHAEGFKVFLSRWM